MRVVSWNAYGADAPTLQSLALQLPKERIDVCVLQETHVQNDSWYDPLRRIPGFQLEPAIPENGNHAIPTGTLFPPDTVRGYAVLLNTGTVALRARPFLIDYTTDGYWGPRMPCSPFDASQKGYNQRPPLVIPITYGGRQATVFTWHAPLDPWNGRALEMFNLCQTLAQATRSQPTVIAGDLNTKSVSGYFQRFAGLQQKNSLIDYILANTPLGNVTEIPGLNVYVGSHWAVAAEIR